MKKLTKEQQVLLEKAIAKLNTFLKEKYNVEYDNAILCLIYKNIIHLNHCSIQNGLYLYADIVLKERKIYISRRKAEYDTINSIFSFDIFYIVSRPKVYSISF